MLRGDHERATIGALNSCAWSDPSGGNVRVLRAVLVVALVGLVGVGGGELFWAGRAAANVDADVRPVRAPRPSGRVEQVTDTTFAESVLREEGPCAVLFYTAGNRDSQRFQRVYGNVAKQYGDEVKFTELDIEQNPRTAQRYRVTAVPTTIVFDHGEAVETIHGVVSEDDLVARLAEVL
ncbi:thioredoxin family protein [Nocardia amikacinitolerans]|uniref:thioredoxin family protein n=1 Tax=Nocardia amikacinitolerans TaxID=756689 RepID=UPI0020A2C8ED|nr:thioredoxin family protein [Nocardia amikacinitolerans]